MTEIDAYPEYMWVPLYTFLTFDADMTEVFSDLTMVLTEE